MRGVVPSRKRLLVRPALIVPELPEIEPADVTVTSLATLTSAVAAVPANLGRNYIIDVLPRSGSYGYYSFPSNYSKGTTNVIVRSAYGGARAEFGGFNARGSSNVTLLNIDVVGTVFDEFGFPVGSSSSGDGTRGVLATGSTGLRLIGLLIYRMAFGVEASVVNNFEIGFCTVRACSVDGIRLFALVAPFVINNVHIHHTRVDMNDTVANMAPDLSVRGLHYVNDRRCAIDPLRSDQKPYGNATSQVLNSAGVLVTVTAGTKAGRHPDCIQLAGRIIGLLIENCELTTNNIYAQGIYGNNADDGGLTPCDDIVYRNVWITSAHPHAMAFQGLWNNVLVDGCMIRPYPIRTWALNMPNGVADDPGVMRPGITTLESSSRINVNNTVLPTQIPSYWTVISNMNVTGLVQSDTAFPVGWETTDVALGLIGHAWSSRWN